ncbi:hypothetical protein U1Q18_046599 [Sarracenia purpurea var. burkii]
MSTSRLPPLVAIASRDAAHRRLTVDVVFLPLNLHHNLRQPLARSATSIAKQSPDFCRALRLNSLPEKQALISAELRYQFLTPTPETKITWFSPCTTAP